MNALNSLINIEQYNFWYAAQPSPLSNWTSAFLSADKFAVLKIL